MSTKTYKKPAKNSKKSSKILGRFEITPSRQPLRYKALWDFEDELVADFTTAGITESLISSHYSLFSSVYSDRYLWLDYSYFLYNVYELGSVSAYPFIRKFDYIKDIYKGIIEGLYSEFLGYYNNDLGISSKNITKYKLYNVCSWFVYHINRIAKYGLSALKLSYDRDFYGEVQENVPKGDYISGSVVQKFVDFMCKKKGCILYKGYKILLEGKDERVCLSMLLIPFEVTKNYSCKKNINDNVLDKSMVTPLKPLVEIRTGSKTKDVISPCDYKEEWLDKISFTEYVLSKHRDMLNRTTLTIGGFELPEHFFRRIWIKDVYDYGRIHDDGTFQTKTSRLRKELIIDGDLTVTVDLCSLHPRLLYTKEGVSLPEDFDPYPELDVTLDKRRINKFKKFYGLDNYDPVRNLSKVALLVLINSKSLVSTVKALEKKLSADNEKLQTRKESEMKFIGLPQDIDLKVVVQKIIEHNKPISKYFNTGIATKLMNMDSDILIEAIDCLVQLDIVCLPLHDSLTVKRGYEEECKKALEYGYKRVVGSLMNFKCEVDF